MKVGTALILEGNHNELGYNAVRNHVGTALILEGNHNIL
ncbi:hypothetical protein HMPREF9699_02004 [Bergeyella zoohelcum ATCC 43767]|uniref:Uncharacterized protein n=1 Tax=Bergeyella zoohelcum ATCC 43767 TaxID=883096 RepID=K1LQ14_9FLAO|nr:hypothetical protein HMPREF9699_02004 [Bergeyella zoohelcum ATCC 43767]SUV49921.1 Uncharacterised protein [Bergeyella zoohelcum]